MDNIYHKGLMIRAVENQLLRGYSERLFGGTIHTCIGQEFLPSLLSEILTNKPFVVSNHRGHGHFIAHTEHIEGLFCEFLGKEGAQSKGIGGSQHLYNNNFISNGVQGCTSPFSVGIGLVKPTILYMGDGTMGNGTVYEAINLSKLTNSKIMFVIEDNGISQSTPSTEVLVGTIANRFSAFDVKVIEADSADPVQMFEILSNLNKIWDINKVLALVVKSYRHNSHSKGDDTRKDEILNQLPDPLKILSNYLNRDYAKDYEKSIKKISDIWNKCLKVRDESFTCIKRNSFNKKIDIRNEWIGRVNENIRHSIEKSLDKEALFIGEDIVTKWNNNDKPYGGAFGVSLGLSDNYDGVIGTSISESGIVGVAAGKAFASKKLSIAEIMFADFATLIVDQIHNGVDKYKKMFGINVEIPLIIRLPYGMGRGYGPTHSQSPFELFSGLSEVLTISYNPLIDYKYLLEYTESEKVSVIVYEPKIYYGDKLEYWIDLVKDLKIEVTQGALLGNFLFSKGENPKFLIITHGSLVKTTLEAVSEIEVDCQILIVNELYPKYNYLACANEIIPIIIVEESNCPYSPLSVSVAKELMLKKVSRDVVVNCYVENIPANCEWEKELITSKFDIKKLIKKVLL